MNAFPRLPLVCETAAPLTVACPHCEQGTRWTSRYGGNDPDVWRVGPCETCDGTGYREICCELCGEYGATEMFQSLPFHTKCATEEKRNAFECGEDA